MSPRPSAVTIFDTTYSLQSVEVTWLRPHVATKLALTDARMAKLRRSIREVTEQLLRASEQGRAA